MVKNPSANAGNDPRVRKIPWRREWLPTPGFLPGEFQGHRSLMGYSPGGRGVGQDLDSTTQQQFTHDNSPKTEVQELISTERPGIAHLQRRDGDSPSSEESHSITSEGSSLQTSELSCDAAGCPRHQGAAGPPQACPTPNPSYQRGRTHSSRRGGVSSLGPLGATAQSRCVKRNVYNYLSPHTRSVFSSKDSGCSCCVPSTS